MNFIQTSYKLVNHLQKSYYIIEFPIKLTMAYYDINLNFIVFIYN